LNLPQEKPQSDGLLQNALTFLLVHQAGNLIQLICWTLSYHQMIQNFQKKLFAAHGKNKQFKSNVLYLEEFSMSKMHLLESEGNKRITNLRASNSVQIYL